MDSHKKEINKREVRYDIDPLFPSRWSARSLKPKPLSREQLQRLFEAARWAPSAFNNQPWRFLFAIRDGEHWSEFISLLSESNRRWAENAGVLIVAISKDTFDYDGKPSRTHSFDAGAAWQNLALQATRMSLVAHAIEGFDYDKAKKMLGIPDGYTVETMIVVGERARKTDLPQDLQVRETPSRRKEISEFVMEGKFVW